MPQEFMSSTDMLEQNKQRKREAKLKRSMLKMDHIKVVLSKTRGRATKAAENMDARKYNHAIHKVGLLERELEKVRKEYWTMR